MYNTSLLALAYRNDYYAPKLNAFNIFYNEAIKTNCVQKIVFDASGNRGIGITLRRDSLQLTR